MTEPRRGSPPAAAAPEFHSCAAPCPDEPTVGLPRIKSKEIIVCGERHVIGCPVYHFKDNRQFSAYHPCGHKGHRGAPPDVHPFHAFTNMDKAIYRYRQRPEIGKERNDLSVLQRIVRQLVVHHDGVDSSETCFHVLHDEKGLSAHFLIDNDGVIYQTLDLADMAFHATGVNSASIGVEMCNRGLVSIDPNFYNTKSPTRKRAKPVLIHGESYEMWEYTDEQYEALACLSAHLLRIFPNLPSVAPEDESGVISTKINQPQGFAGFLGHYHVTKDKWDPGCFDFGRLITAIRPRPIFAFGSSERRGDEAAFLFHNNEQQAMGGYFPVGPCGSDLVFHGGIHLHLAKGLPLRTSFPGRIVAARFSEQETPIGSCNFVLVRHSVHVSGLRVVFFMLYFHLTADALSSLPWFVRASGKLGTPFVDALRRGETVFPDAGVVAGEAVGQVGRAGPAGRREPQVHVEVMTREPLGRLLDPPDQPYFVEIDCANQGAACVEPRIQTLLGGLSPAAFFRASQDTADMRRRAAELRRLAVCFRSEWAAQTADGHSRSLQQSAAWQRLPAYEREQIFCTQIEPTLWWTKEVAVRTGLPESPIVWHYHPVAFVTWLTDKLRQLRSRVEASRDKNSSTVTDGFDGDNAYFTVEESEMNVPSVSMERYDYVDVANGYPAHWLLD